MSPRQQPGSEDQVIVTPQWIAGGVNLLRKPVRDKLTPTQEAPKREIEFLLVDLARSKVNQ